METVVPYRESIEKAGFIHIEGVESSMPPIVMLHGLFGKLSNFEPILPFLRNTYDIWIPELPLYSQHSNAETIRGLSEWVLAWMQFKQIDSAVLLGNSLGGHVALDIASTNPTIIDGLILVGSSGLFESGFGYSNPRRFDREYIRMKASEAFFEHPVHDTMVDEIHEVITDRILLARLVRLARSARISNLEHILPRIQTPTALIWGDQDIITPAAVALQFNDLLPNSELFWISNCGHVPMMESPHAFAKTVNQFMERFSNASVVSTNS